MKIVVVIPVYNEHQRCIKVLEKIKRYRKNFYKCVIVDDGSKDKTPGMVAKFIKKDDFFALVKHSINMGKGAAMRTGAEFAWSSGAEAVIFMDGDGQHSVDLLQNFKESLKSSQLVFGYRDFGNKMPFYRKVGNVLARWLVKVLFKIDRKDLLCGYFGITKEIYPKIIWDSNRYGVETEIATLVAKRKLNFSEVKVDTIYLHKYKGVTPLDAFRILSKIPGWYFSK